MGKIVHMMPLNQETLRLLLTLGYHVLEAKDLSKDEKPVFRPRKVHDLGAYLASLDLSGDERSHQIIIRDALENIPDDLLQGTIWMEETTSNNLNI